MKNLRILESSDLDVTAALLASDPPVQLKELRIAYYYDGYSLLWNYLARMTSLTHLSLTNLDVNDDTPSLISPFQDLQYLHIHVALAPRFADQPMKKMRIDIENDPEELMVEVRQHWRGIVFPHVEFLEVDQPYDYDLDSIPIEFWREFLLIVSEVVSRHVSFLDKQKACSFSSSSSPIAGSTTRSST